MVDEQILELDSFLIKLASTDMASKLVFGALLKTEHLDSNGYDTYCATAKLINHGT